MSQAEIKKELKELLDAISQNETKLKLMKSAKFQLAPEDFEEVIRTNEIIQFRMKDLIDKL